MSSIQSVAECCDPLPAKDKLPSQVCRGSHRSRAFERLRSTYGQSSVGRDGTLSGWLTDNGASLQQQVGRYSLDWRTADMQVRPHASCQGLPGIDFARSTYRDILLRAHDAKGIPRLTKPSCLS